MVEYPHVFFRVLLNQLGKLRAENLFHVLLQFPMTQDGIPALNFLGDSLDDAEAE